MCLLKERMASAKEIERWMEWKRIEFIDLSNRPQEHIAQTSKIKVIGNECVCRIFTPVMMRNM